LRWTGNTGKIVAVEPSANIFDAVIDALSENGHMENALVIFPHRRAVSFMRYYIAKRFGKSLLLPEMYAFEDWAMDCYVRNNPQPRTLISEYDQAWLVYKAYCKASGESVSWEHFFSWAMRIVDFFREFELELKTPHDFLKPYPEIDRQAKAILERLGSIYERFSEMLDERGWSTFPKVVRELALSEVKESRPVYVVGFYALTEAESRIFESFYRNGASIFWHTERNLAPLYAKWKEKWRLSDERISWVESDKKPSIHFYECHSLHGELEKLNRLMKDLKNVSEPDRYAVILLDQNALIPVVHHLPPVDVNITMGYPFKMTGLFAFIKTLKELILSKRNGKYPARLLLDLLRMPYAKDKKTEEAVISYGAPFVSAELFSKAHEEFVKPFEEAKTPSQLAEALEKLIRILHQRGALGVFEKGFVLKMLDTVIPVLKESLFSRFAMEKTALFSLLEEILLRLSIPFEGEPLRGLQVMGLLESRLLSFENLFILDANEGILPGVEESNPIAPQKVKNTLKLPDRIREEKIVQYHFERLIKSSRNVHIFWQHQITSEKDGLEGKKIKSRFVEKLIWEIERKRRRRLAPSEIKKTAPHIIPESFKKPEPLRKTDEMKEAVATLLKKKELSQSFLKSYLNCPLSFYYKNLLNIKEAPTLQEVLLNEVGEAMHDALCLFYRKMGRLPISVKKEKLELERLVELFKDFLKTKKFYQHASPERKYLLEYGAKVRLKNFIENQPDETEVVALEKSFSTEFETGSGEIGKVNLTGKVDRIDRRNGTLIVLDYKTGKVDRSNINFGRASGLDPSVLEFDDESLKEILKKVNEIQLPLYMYLVKRAGYPDRDSPITAGYIDLYKSGKELFYLDPKGEEALSELDLWLDETFPEILGFIIKHMVKSDYWYPAVNESMCRYCGYRNMCKYCAV